MAKIKHVHPTDDIPGIWISETQPDKWAKNKQNNLWFNNDSLYSYGTEICRRIRTPAATIYLTCLETFSATTLRHQSALQWTLRTQNKLFFEVPRNGWGCPLLNKPLYKNGSIQFADRKRIVDFMAQKIVEEYAKASGALIYTEGYIDKAKQWGSKVIAFQRYFPPCGGWGISDNFTGINLIGDSLEWDGTQTKEEHKLKWMDEFLKPRKNQKWIDLEDAREVVQKYSWDMIEHGLLLKHVRFTENKGVKITRAFSELNYHHPKELESLTTLQKVMAS